MSELLQAISVGSGMASRARQQALQEAEFKQRSALFPLQQQQMEANLQAQALQIGMAQHAQKMRLHQMEGSQQLAEVLASTTPDDPKREMGMWAVGKQFPSVLESPAFKMGLDEIEKSKEAANRLKQLEATTAHYKAIEKNAEERNRIYEKSVDNRLEGAGTETEFDEDGNPIINTPKLPEGMELYSMNIPTGRRGRITVHGTESKANWIAKWFTEKSKNDIAFGDYPPEKQAELANEAWDTYQMAVKNIKKPSNKPAEAGGSPAVSNAPALKSSAKFSYDPNTGKYSRK